MLARPVGEFMQINAITDYDEKDWLQSDICFVWDSTYRLAVELNGSSLLISATVAVPEHAFQDTLLAALALVSDMIFLSSKISVAASSRNELLFYTFIAVQDCTSSELCSAVDRLIAAHRQLERL